jgi:hypothetical protein
MRRQYAASIIENEAREVTRVASFSTHGDDFGFRGQKILVRNCTVPAGTPFVELRSSVRELSNIYTKRIRSQNGEVSRELPDSQPQN